MTTPTGETAGAGMELLPCPFCGGEVTVEQDENGAWWSIDCDRCDIYIEPFVSKGIAIAAWNRRTATAHHEQLQQRVVELEAQVRHMIDVLAEYERQEFDV